MSSFRSKRQLPRKSKKITSLLLVFIIVLLPFGSFAYADEGAGEIAFTSSYYTIGEWEGVIMLNVTRTGGSAGQVSVDYTTVDGSATGGSDYFPISGTLIFQDGEVSTTIGTDIYYSNEAEGEENFSVKLSNPTGGATIGSNSTAKVVITDTDYNPVPGQSGEFNLSAAAYSVGEGDGNATLTVNRTNGSEGQVSVDYAIGGTGSATEGWDYIGTGGQLVFDDGETSKTIQVRLLDDSEYEGDEYFYVVLGSPTGGATIGSLNRAAVTIVDNEIQPELTLESGTYTITETGYKLSLNVLREKSLNNLVTVDYTTAAGTAEGGSDYIETSGTLYLYSGQSSGTIEIEIIDDKVHEGSETFTVNLSNPTGGAKLGSITTAQVNILDDDPPQSQIQFSASGYTGIEKSEQVSVIVTRSGYTGGAATVDYATTSGTAIAGDDFIPASGTLTFAQGENSKTIIIKLVNDKKKEPLESFSVQLSNPTGGAVIEEQGKVTVTIQDK